MKKFLICLIVIVCLGVCVFSIYNKNNNEKNIENNNNDITNNLEIENLKVATISGPTGFGMAKLTEDDFYDMTICSSPEEIVAKLTTNDIDIAAVPINLSATLYNKTQGNIKLLALNTMGNLYIVTSRDDINTIDDLKDKTIVTSGLGATPELVVSTILQPLNVNAIYQSEHSETVSQLVSKKYDIALLPEPFVTVALSKDSTLNVAIDMSEEWKKSFESDLPMGCIVARSESLGNENAIKKFMKDYKDSIEFVNENHEEAARLIKENNIFANEDIARDSIEKCNIKFIDGNEMKKVVENYLNLINEYNSKMIGEKIPDEEFYY